MADTFVFSNFAVAALQESVGAYDGVMEIHPDDVDKFPTLAQGTKFAIILQDASDNVEICYVTALTGDGTMTVERGREQTTPQAWSAGTLVQHGFTAATVYAGARINPRGEWNGSLTYSPGDSVVYGNISYIANQLNENQVPSPGSAYWQVIYQPPGAESGAVSWGGEYSGSTTYAIGTLVAYRGRVWIAKAISTGELPDVPSDYWDPLSVGPENAKWEGILVTTTQANNYVIESTAAVPLPDALYDGLSVRFMVQATNTSTTPTLQVGGSAPKPLRYRSGIGIAEESLTPGTVYEFIYRLASDEFISISAIGVEIAAGEILTDLEPRLTEIETDIGTLNADKASKNAPSVTGGMTLTGGLDLTGTFNFRSLQMNFVDAGWGTRSIYHNDGLMGFLTSGGGWSAYCDNAGNLVAIGNITAFASDERLKTNLRPAWDDPIKAHKKLRGYKFDWREDTPQPFKGTEIGLLAQDVEKAVGPEGVELAPFNRGPDGKCIHKTQYKTIKMGQQLAALQVETINALIARVEELEKIIAGLPKGLK